jgi:short-subunit dehydrogenase
MANSLNPKDMKKAMITGASTGIGLETARQLAGEGYSLTLVARSDEKLKEIVKSLSGQHDYIKADLSEADGVNKVAAHFETTHYDVLVNNAGVGLYGRFDQLDLAEQLKMIRLNIEATVILSHAYLRHSTAGDALMNLGSVLGSTSFSGGAAYAGTKGFVVRFSESLWHEYKNKNIYVGVFSPGVTSSDFYKESGIQEDSFPGFIKQTPIQVARELAKALRSRNKPHVVSGALNRAMLFFYRLLTRKAIVNSMGSFSPVK